MGYRARAGECIFLGQRVYRVETAGTPEFIEAIERTARVLMAGGLALIPTETVYGLAVAVDACHPGDPRSCPAVNGQPTPDAQSGYRRIFEVKHRSLEQTVPWLVAGPEALDAYGSSVDVRLRALAQSLWPGALTLIVPANERVPRFMCAPDGTVALRASASPVVAELVRACGCPLATTSANTHGLPAPASFAEVEQTVLEGVDVAIDAGATACRDASTIVALPSGGLNIIRQGALSAGAIRQALDASAARGKHDKDDVPRGMS